MLRIGLAAVEQGPVETSGSVAVHDPLLADLEFRLDQPVAVSGQVSAAGPGAYYWQGRLETGVTLACRRCLAPVHRPVGADIGLLFTEDQSAADDPSVVVITPRSRTLDLAPALREELIFAVPEFVLCREDCRGLCPRCGADLNQGPCGCGPEAPDPRWAGLAELKQKLESER